MLVQRLHLAIGCVCIMPDADEVGGLEGWLAYPPQRWSYIHPSCRNRETIITALQGANLAGFERVPPAAEPVLQPGARTSALRAVASGV